MPSFDQICPDEKKEMIEKSKIKLTVLRIQLIFFENYFLTSEKQRLNLNWFF